MTDSDEGGPSSPLICFDSGWLNLVLIKVYNFFYDLWIGSDERLLILLIG
jgi:hypothetical protein